MPDHIVPRYPRPQYPRPPYVAGYPAPLNGYRGVAPLLAQAAPAPAPRRRRRRSVIVLAALASTLFLAAGVLTALLVMAGRDHDAAAGRLDDVRAELTGVRERVASAEAERNGVERRNTALQAEKSELSACVEAMRHYLWDGLTGTARSAALNTMFTECG